MDAIYKNDGDALDVIAAAAILGGKVFQLRDGRAGVIPTDIALAKKGAAQTDGVYLVTKTANLVILDGGKVFWDASAAAAHFKPVNDADFYLGVAIGDAASADTTMLVCINELPRYISDLSRDAFTSVPVGTAAAGGFGRPYRLGGCTKEILTATNEAQKVDALARYGFSPASKPIVEMEVNNVTNGAGGSQDFNIGLATGTHATDADAITNHIFLHIDGNSLLLNFQSKDGTTTVAATSSTVSCVAGTPFEVWMDCRDLTNVKFYIDGVRVLSGTTFSFAAGTTTLFPLAHLEKTASTDVFDVDVNFLRARLGTQTNNV